MAIRLEHNPVGISGLAAYATGVGRAQERQRTRATDRLFAQQEAQQERADRFNILEAQQGFLLGRDRFRAKEDERARIGAETRRADLALDAEERAAERAVKSADYASSLSLLYEIADDKRALTAKGLRSGELKYSPTQNTELAKLDEKRRAIDKDPNINEADKVIARAGVERDRAKIIPGEVPAEERREALQREYDELAEGVSGSKLQKIDGVFKPVDSPSKPQLTPEQEFQQYEARLAAQGRSTLRGKLATLQNTDGTRMYPTAAAIEEAVAEVYGSSPAETTEQPGAVTPGAGEPSATPGPAAPPTQVTPGAVAPIPNAPAVSPAGASPGPRGTVPVTPPAGPAAAPAATVEQETQASARLQKAGFSIDEYVQAERVLEDLEEQYPDVKSMDDLPEGTRSIASHAALIRDIARGKR